MQSRFPLTAANCAFTANTDADAATQHERRSLHCAGGWRSGTKADHDKSSKRLGSHIFTRWEMDRVSRADASRLGKRSLAINAVRPREGRSNQFDREYRSQYRFVCVESRQQVDLFRDRRKIRNAGFFDRCGRWQRAETWFWATVSTAKLKSARMVAHWYLPARA